MTKPAKDLDVDLFVIGGGVNGCGIARDAAGRGLRVALAEMNDLGWATSSASTKLFHGGLRYLEFFEFRLVREALIEREVLLAAMPHISWPKRFVLPLDPAMRFDSETPTSRLLSWVMPWAKGRRPAWLIRFGLMLYDHLGGRKILPGTKTLNLTRDPAGAPLKPHFKKAFEYSDCWVEDARLVVLNARDAAKRGANIMPHTKVIQTRREDAHWIVEVERADGTRAQVRARAIINTAGPWVEQVNAEILGTNSTASVRLVRGSHIVTRKLFDHDKCYFFQGQDGRVIFAIPYETDFTLIGTTDAAHDAPDQKPECTDEEADYLCAFASTYFREAITREDIIWRYSGVRPLYDDGADSATAATREYVLELHEGAAPLLNVYGGKITTYRKLAEAALTKIGPLLPAHDASWTAGAPLPGGDFPVDGVDKLVSTLRATYPFLNERWALRLVRAYGTDCYAVLGDATDKADLGQDFGATLSEREVKWLIDHEWVASAEDLIWRRSKLGLRLNEDQIDTLSGFIAHTLT